LSIEIRSGVSSRQTSSLKSIANDVPHGLVTPKTVCEDSVPRFDHSPYLRDVERAEPLRRAVPERSRSPAARLHSNQATSFCLKSSVGRCPVGSSAVVRHAHPRRRKPRLGQTEDILRLRRYDHVRSAKISQFIEVFCRCLVNPPQPNCCQWAASLETLIADHFRAPRT
jgi:hypothetical protein